MSDMPLFDRVSREPEPEPPAPRIFAVAEINRAARLLVERDLGDVWIEGELSDVRPSAAGHVYFALNDADGRAQLRGVIFRADARRSKTKLADGARVRMRGKVSLFEPRGQFQFIAHVALPDGDGARAAELEKLKRRLAAEGLMDPAKKRRLPRLPRVVGVVTSVSGAALHDIIRVAAGRCPVRVVVADCRVQGDDAPASIVRALALIGRLPDLDVVIVGRGGGSAEDLCAFNDERVVRAIAACPVPTVSAVGHEVDFTLADLVADVRAATPSNAAEIVVPDRRALAAELATLERRLARAMETHIERGRLMLDRASRALEDPRHALAAQHRRLGLLRERLAAAARGANGAARADLLVLHERLGQQHPRVVLDQDKRRLFALEARLDRAGRAMVARRHRALIELRAALYPLGRPIAHGGRETLGALAGRLSALSPLAVLERGFSIAQREEDPTAVRSVRALPAGTLFRLRLPDGEIAAESRGVVKQKKR